ncbi:MAG: DUF1343 domain-containing protein [Saprospiraceae bacterium]
MAYLRSILFPPGPAFYGLGSLISIFFLICDGCAQIPINKTYDDNEIRPGAMQTEEYLPLLKGKRVGLVINQTSLIHDTYLVDSLISLKVNVVKLYAPEHGLRGKADAGEAIDNGIDTKTDLPVISLYGDKKKPTQADLEGVDIMIFDIQDVGARFYTYISTLHYLMDALGAQGIPLIVLDRPNPNGHYVDGPVLDTVRFRSFVGMDPIPVVYGMTIGELGRMINSEKWIHSTCNLTVIKCKNYDHTRFYELPIKPSPNLPNIRSILLYPSLCFFEGTIVSLGRGTSTPFQVLGNPLYPDSAFSFIPVSMQGAQHPPLEGKKCFGIDLSLVNVDSLFQTRQINLSLLITFYKALKNERFFNPSWFDKLSGGPGFREAIESSWTEAQIRASWKKGIDEFKVKRKPYLLYAE